MTLRAINSVLNSAARLCCQRLRGKPVIDEGSNPTASACTSPNGVTLTAGIVALSVTGDSPGMPVGGMTRVTGRAVGVLSQSIAESGASWAEAAKGRHSRANASLVRIQYHPFAHLFLRGREIRPQKRPDIGIGHQRDGPQNDQNEEVFEKSPHVACLFVFVFTRYNWHFDKDHVIQS